MSLLSTFADLLKPAPPPDPVVLAALGRIDELVDPVLRAAGNFQRQLADPVRHALDYCDELVGGLPGPLEISHRAFAVDPLVHALFATADDIHQMLGRSQAVRDFLEQPCSLEADHFYAMFAARRLEKHQLGLAQQGDVIRNDVPQTVVYFSSQTLTEPNCQLQRTLLALRCKAFDSLLHSFHAHVEALRRERDGLRQDLAQERNQLAHPRIGDAVLTQGIATRHIAELDAHLRLTAESLMPEHLLPALANHLRQPEPALRLTPVSIAVDRLGVVHDQAGDDENVHTLNFPEFTARDRRLHLAMLARIDRAEAQAAVDLVRDQQHRFLII